ncbi:MAG: phytanoyl-CoA dioxygenase family protein [Alphaproteobacteria bacterium]|nr:phytanoyl-CoA dioxygenase family protein [Alphaproteobacteria bacterium]
MLSEDQIRQYHEDGFVIPEFRMPESVLDSIKDRHRHLLDRHPEFRDYCSAVLQHDEGFLSYCRNDEILDMVEQLIGPDIALWNSSFFAKPAVNGKATPWHQDGEYWPIRPLATCTVWLAVDDATTENGCLRVIRGSHRERRLRAHETNPSEDLTLNQELLKSEFDEAEAVDLVLEKGQISLHDVFLVHGSEPNRSPRSRRGMTMRFMPTTSVFDHVLAREQYNNLRVPDHSERKIFHMRGIDRSGRNKLVYA